MENVSQVILMTVAARLAKCARVADYKHVEQARDLMIEAENEFARIEHGARCFMRQNVNRPWGEP